MWSNIKSIHTQENQHHSINATKQLILQGAYWWPTIAKDISLFIILCSECGEKEEPPKEVDLTNPNTSREMVPYKKTTDDWRTPLIEYIVHGRLSTGTQREQREIIWESKNLH